MTTHDLECEYAKLFDSIEAKLPDPQRWYGDHKKRRFRAILPLPVVFSLVGEADPYPTYEMEPMCEWELAEYVEEEDARRYNAERFAIDYIRQFTKSWENAKDKKAWLKEALQAIWHKHELTPLFRKSVQDIVRVWFTDQYPVSWRPMPVPPDAKVPPTKLKWVLVDDGRTEWLKRAAQVR